MSGSLHLGIDLGGTKIEIIALDETGRERSRRRVPSPAGDYDAIVATIARLVLDTEQQLGERGTVGVGTPGAPSRRTGVMKNANSTALIGRTLREDLSRALEREIRLANDANCFALSEARDGAARGADVVLGIILGTGVGGGIVVGGRPLEGRNAIAGEWGHNPLPWCTQAERPGPACYCGKHGCAETFLSGPAFARDYVLGGGVAAMREATAIAAAAAAGEPLATAALERYLDRLARAMAALVNVLDPDAIVLGGGVSNIGALYTELPVRLRAYVFSDAVETPVLPPLHGDSSGVRGAAWLWP